MNFYLFFNVPATSEISTLSLHDALPIYRVDRLLEELAGFGEPAQEQAGHTAVEQHGRRFGRRLPDRKSTRLNSSHITISYAVFCLKKKNIKNCNQRGLSLLLEHRSPETH